jgi:hypothetical protein
MKDNKFEQLSNEDIQIISEAEKTLSAKCGCPIALVAYKL